MPGQEQSDAHRRAQLWIPLWLNQDRFQEMVTLAFFGFVYIVTSAAMIAFNKYLVHKDRFPFAIVLVLIHAGFSSVSAFILLLVKPSLFPSLCGKPEERATLDMKLVLKGALPIAFLFSVQLVLSNTAYLHLSMAFLQMMKECNLCLVYLFSLLVGAVSFNWMHCRVLGFIVVATFVTIQGELNFSLMGFLIQGTGQLFECLKIVMQALLLSSAGPKLDVLTYVILVMPLCFLCLSSCLFALMYVHPLENLKIPAMADITAWWPVLLANATLAFALNVSIALFMKNSSAVAFILAGIFKDAVIVLVGALYMHEHISVQQGVGFSIQLALIWLWSMMKIFPEKFENGVMEGLKNLTQPDRLIEKRSLLETVDTGSEAQQKDQYGATEATDGLAINDENSA